MADPHGEQGGPQHGAQHRGHGGEAQEGRASVCVCVCVCRSACVCVCVCVCVCEREREREMICLYVFFCAWMFPYKLNICMPRCVCVCVCGCVWVGAPPGRMCLLSMLCGDITT